MDTEEQIQEKIKEAYALLETESHELPDRLYKGIEGVSSLFLAWKKSDGAPGWSQTLVDLDQKPLFTKEESSHIERSFDSLKPLFFERQQGGGLPPIDPKDISIDKLYHSIFDTLDKYDEQYREITDQLGIVKAIETTDKKGVVMLPFVPPIPVPYYILGKAILPFLNAILEFLRLAVSNTLLDVPSLRILLSIAIAFLDLLRGEWKNAVLSLFGVISASGATLGFVGKLVRNAWLLISPDLQKQLRDDIFKSSKSMMVGFLIWSFTVFSPDLLRFTVDQAFDKMRVLVEEFNQKSGDLEEKAQEVSSKMGLQVKFPKLPLDMIPSIDDIQTLQSLVQVPELYCSPEFQKIIAPLLLIPPLRLLLELLNIPTIEEDIATTCKTVDTSSLSKSVADLATPQISIIPGGIADQAAKAKEALEHPEEFAKSLVPKELTEKYDQAQAVLKNPQALVPKELTEKYDQAQAVLKNPANFAIQQALKGGNKNLSRKRKHSKV